MEVIFVMLVMGALLGFVGAGGAGLIIAILTIAFHVPIITALGTSLAAMAFTSLSGAYSHYREGNINVKVGVMVGITGAIGSFIGSKVAVHIPGNNLHFLTSGMLFLSALLLLVRLYLYKESANKETKLHASINMFVPKAILLGLVTGVFSGTFGIGSAPFIQLGLLMVMGLTIQQAVGTTMLVILPIAIGGGTGFLTEGHVDIILLLQVLIGTMAGAFIGAKFTNLLPKVVLKTAMVMIPMFAALLLVF
jgi:uncharacterized membrane protein YfcA